MRLVLPAEQLRTIRGTRWTLFNVSNPCARLNNLIPHLQFISCMYSLYSRDFRVIKISWVKEPNE